MKEQEVEFEFVFELPIIRTGFFLMERKSWDDWLASPNFSKRFLKSRLKTYILKNGKVKIKRA